jgi:hypothetical protein
MPPWPWFHKVRKHPGDVGPEVFGDFPAPRVLRRRKLRRFWRKVVLRTLDRARGPWLGLGWISSRLPPDLVRMVAQAMGLRKILGRIR